MAAATGVAMNRGGWTFLCGALLAVWLVTPTETLDVTIFASPKKVLVEDDVFLECKITGSQTLDLSNVGVQWTGPQNQEIFIFNGGIFTPKRQGAKMSQNKLQEGDASLHLTNIQLDEEGKYTCIVFVTPEKVEKSSILQVSARPTVRLSPSEIDILIGSEGSVSCNVTEFYPQDLQLSWQKIPNKGPKEPQELKHDICTGAFITNTDRTFSISSRVTIKPTLDDDGDVYRCVVTHRSVLPDGLSQESKLIVTELEKPSTHGAVAASVIATLLACVILFIFGLCYWYKIKGVAPEIIECNMPNIFRHLEETTISYKVNRFRPWEIKIDLILKRRDQIERTIFEWCSPENKTRLVSKSNTHEVCLLVNGCQEDPSFRPLIPEICTNKDGTFRVRCDVKIYPDLFRDNEAELTFHVHHKAIAQPALKVVKLDVKGVPPKVSNIVVPFLILHNELVALTCSINGFKPRPLKIRWQQKGKNDELKEIVGFDQNNRTVVPTDNGTKRKCNHHISEAEYEDKSCGITSVLVIMPDILQDQGTEYICEVQHECTGSVARKSITLIITATPKLDKITYGAEKPVAGEPMTLYCRIHSFYPNNIRVTWLKNNEEMIEESEESESTLGNDGLYYLTSSVKCIPTRADVGKKFRCQVEHETLLQTLEVDWELDQLVSAPKVTEVIADPAHPEVGKPVTLSCKAFDFFPKDSQIFWFKGFEKTNDGVETDDIQLNSAGLYSRWSKRTFIPTYLDHGKEFKMQILHSETSNKPVSSSHFLKIMGIPSVEDIKFDPPDSMYGTDLTLICNVSNFYPQAIETFWRKNGKQVVSGMTVKGPVREENGCFRLTSHLQIKTTAENFDEEFSFHVNHIQLKVPITKTTFLTCPALSPTLSAIKVGPAFPDVSQPIILSVSLTSYAPAPVQVKWFKNEKPFLGVINRPSPVIADDSLFSSIASIEFIAAEDDHGSLFRCEVLHAATKKIQEKNLKLLLQDGNDKDGTNENKAPDEDEEVSQITCQTKCPRAGQPVTISCTVKGTTVDDAHITWYRDVYPFEDMSCIANTPFKTGVGFTTALTYTPKQEDHNCQFQVDVITEMDPICRYFRLKLS
ncbi:uncharacterized protein LOC119971843 [Scyliorhinus canicula]|uniref:uncharacterized protein LOC119971843 n=1 Tax=Scyliorhinus canicula TaxID=7830 RepID=UPI0018F34E98|nr:uncharacterized protein LOC119971843 [Scyliorhinus canicula]